MCPKRASRPFAPLARLGVQGAEHLALQGMKKTLAENEAVIS
jgi:hypothetical protein